MQYISQFLFGLSCFGKAFTFIFKHRLYWFFFLPAVLMLGIYYLGSLIQTRNVEENLNTVNDIVWFCVQLLIEMSVALLLMKFAKYMVVVLLSPLLSFLSMRCEKILTGKTYPMDAKQLLLDVKRSLSIVTRNIMWEYSFFLIIFIVSFIGWGKANTSPIFYLTFLIGFFYYGFSFIDYINERRKLNIDESILFIRKYRGLAVAIGGIFSLLILMPVDLSILFSFATQTEVKEHTIGQFLVQFILWILASVAPVVTIVAATIAMHGLNLLPAQELTTQNASNQNKNNPQDRN